MNSQLTHLRLERAREPGLPDGDAASGIDLVAFLTAEGALDAAARAEREDGCRARLFEHEQTVRVGRLTREDGRWRLDFPGEAEDMTGFRLQDERFVLGEYVSFEGRDGVHVYRVAQVGPA